MSGAGRSDAADGTGGPGSELDRAIPPEIKDDRLARALRRLAAAPGVRTVLEVGSSSGDGSTDAFVAGALENPEGPPELHCLELSRTRFERLVARHGHRDFVRCHNVSSVRVERFLGPEEIRRFCRGIKPWLRRRTAGRYLEWLEQDRRYALEEGTDADGIRDIVAEHGIDAFGAVLIDGSEFTGPAILEDVYGARYLALDDIRGLKNHGNYKRLKKDDGYEMVERSWWLRNGYAIFERRES